MNRVLNSLKTNSMKIFISILLGLTLTIFGCTKEVKNNQSTSKIHTLKYIAESPVKTKVTYENKTGANVSEYFTGSWQYEAQIEAYTTKPFWAYLNIRKEDSKDESKITGIILIDGKVVQEGSSTAWTGVTCNYTVE
jgi:ABC-type molybdate transport system substrate-binding protein